MIVEKPVRARLALLPLLLGLVALPTGPLSGALRKPGRFDQSGIEGSGQAVMQPVNTGVRVALVASVAGSSTKEAWAIGRSTAKAARWAGTEGQTVFLHYTARSGWVLEGPPVDASGNPQNPTLTSISLAKNGDGWAVGGRGEMAHLEGGRWVMALKKTEAVLSSVSIGSNGATTYGFAVGQGPTVLRLFAEGNWAADRLEVEEGETWDLLGVGAVGPNEAWAAGASAGAALILRRDSGGWKRLETGQPLFDGRGARTVEGTAVLSTRAGAVSATPDGAWVGGTIIPVDPGASLGDPAGDATRPFALHFTTDGRSTAFCPDQYSIGSDRKASTTALCSNPFPLAGFGIATMHAFPGGNRGEAFAGGLGLFHYRDGAWFREPNAVSFVSSVGFSSPAEGWVAGTGNTYGASGAVSSIGTLGHWTTSPASPRMARWPEPVTDESRLISHPLEAVALAPDGSGRALVVGQSGSMLAYRPEVGWDSFTKRTAYALHGLAWPSLRGAWAVGGRGTILRYDGSRWSSNAASEALTTGSLFAVAFSSEDRGYAVGANGAILRYDGTRWSKDPAHLKLTGGDLLAIGVAGGEFVAAGVGGTILVNRRGVWSRQDGLESLLSRGGQLPALYAVKGLADGTALVGGEMSTLIRRDGESGAWRVDREGSRVPPEGTILALEAWRAGGTLNVFASVSYERLKYAGETPAALTGFLLRGTSTGWRDLGFDTQLTAYPTFDASAPRDPVYGMAVEGSRAWAVGGTGVGVDDAQGHVQAFPTSSIFRVDLTGDPRAVGHTVTPVLDTDESLVTFAFFGETACGRGLCSAGMGTGTKADVVPAQIQEEVNSMSKLPGGPRFVLFGGNMRRTGIPEELGEFKRYADAFSIPFFAVMGRTDLFSGLTTSALDELPDYSGGFVDQQVSPPTNDNSFYMEMFRDRPVPWGERRPAPRGIQPVSIGMAPNPGARTHYAFDYVEGKRKLRIILLDTSAVGRVSDPNHETNRQNPPQHQNTWLTQVLEDARAKALPSIVVMNRPPLNPLELDPNVPTDAVDAYKTASGLGASAILSSHFRQNGVGVVKLEGLAATVPVYVFGGGGAPLDARPDRPADPSIGYYHSWQLVSVSLDERRRYGPLRQAEVYVRSYPVVETVALHAIDGVVVRGGNTLRFTGSGRAPDGGGPNDPLQSRAAVVPLDFRSAGVCREDVGDGYRVKCNSALGGPVGPAYRFVSENPAIGYFVLPDPLDEKLPYLNPATGSPVPDSTSGLFCAIGAGSTYVNLISGFHRARMQLTVSGGYGSCVKEPVPPLPPLPPAPALAPLPRSAFLPFLATPVVDVQSVAIVPPPPVPIVAPAPPAAGSFAKREKHQEAKETEMSSFAAIQHKARSEAVQIGLMFVLGVGIIVLSAALVFSRLGRVAAEPAAYTIHYPDGRRRIR